MTETCDARARSRTATPAAAAAAAQSPRPCRDGDAGRRRDRAQPGDRRLDRRPEPGRERVGGPEVADLRRSRALRARPRSRPGSRCPASSWPRSTWDVEGGHIGDVAGSRTAAVSAASDGDEHLRRRVAGRRHDAQPRPRVAAELEPERHDDDRRQHEHEEQVAPVADLSQQVDPPDLEGLADLGSSAAPGVARGPGRAPPVTQAHREQHADGRQAVDGRRAGALHVAEATQEPAVRGEQRDRRS